MTVLPDTVRPPRMEPTVPLTLGVRATSVGPHEVLDGQILLQLPGLARALVDADTTIIEPEPTLSPEDGDWLARRHVRTAERLVRGGFALWASGVIVTGKAVALIGDDASGKSTVAASLALRGCPVLSDANLEVELDGTTPVARAVTDTLELWPDSVRKLGLETADGKPVRAGIAKQGFRFPAAGSASLSTVVVLTSSPGLSEIECEELTGSRALEPIADATCLGRLVAPLGLRSAHFLWLTRLHAGVKVLRVATNRFAPDLTAVTDAILAGIDS